MQYGLNACNSAICLICLKLKTNFSRNKEYITKKNILQSVSDDLKFYQENFLVSCGDKSRHGWKIGKMDEICIRLVFYLNLLLRLKAFFSQRKNTQELRFVAKNLGADFEKNVSKQLLYQLIDLLCDIAA